jgi:glycosyltransferase involved in cell wall biosynthesis
VASPAARTRIVVFTQFYPPEATAASNRVSAVARALVQAGNEVTVVTGLPSFPNGIVPASHLDPARRREQDGAIAIRRVWTYASPRLRTIDRMLNWLSVAFGATLQALFSREPIDVVLVSSPPISLAMPALVASIVHRARLVVDVRDVYPDVAIKLGVWKRDSAIARLVGAVADLLYRRASLILTVTETCRREVLARGVPPEKVVTAPNGFDRLDAIVSAPVERRPGEFVVAYAGNMGVATGIGVVLDAAQHLRSDPKYRFVLVGGGADGDGVARRIAAEQLENVVLLGPQSRTVAAAVMARADVCVVPLKRGVVDSLPTKLLDALAQGTPVIVCAAGEAREFIERSGGGIAVDAEDGQALAAAISSLAADPPLCRSLASSGLAYVTEHYDRANVVADISRRIAALSVS